MRILVVHNSYRQAGGEDAVFADEVALLGGAGHDVATLLASNDDIDGLPARIATAALAGWRPAGRRQIAGAIAAHRPDVVHVHNFFPLLSPAIFDACAAANVPAVWTLHNFRVACAGGLLLRDGVPCAKCVDGSAAWGVVHRCYRGSAAGSAAVAAMIGLHRGLGTWQRKVARFIALGDFARTLLVRAGLPPERIVVKPNGAADPGAPSAATRAGLLFVGRLSPEKGVRTLIEAVRASPVPLTIIGDGPERAALEADAPPHVTFLGRQPPERVQAAMAAAQALVVPSHWYEPCPLVVIEAMARATPVIAARIGALPDLVADGGLLFAPRDPAALAATIATALADPAGLATMGQAGRRRYKARHAPAATLAALTAIYGAVIAEAAPAHRAAVRA